MKYLQLSYLFLFTLLISSCNPFEYLSYYSLYLTVEDINGLAKDEDVFSNGKAIGKVNEFIPLEDSIYLIELKMKKDVLIPKNSDVRIVTDMDLSSAHIEITFSHSRRNYSENDTLHTQGSVMFNKNIHLQELDEIPEDLPEGIKYLLK